MASYAHSDFETRSPVDLGKCGPYRYAKDPHTEVMCYTVRLGRKRFTWFFKDPLKNATLLAKFGGWLEKGNLFVAHNVEFEYAIWNYCFVNQISKLTGLSLPKLHISQLRCNAAQAAVLTYPRDLSNLCKVLGTREKNLDGKKVMLKLSKPRKPTKNNPSIWHESNDDFKTLIKYNIDDVEAETESSLKLPPLEKTELELFHHTIEMNERGLKVDYPLVKRAHKFVGQFNEEKKVELSSLTNGEVTSGKQVAKLKSHIEQAGYNIPNLQADTVETALMDSKLKGKARRLVELRMLLAKSSISKLQTMLDSCYGDYRVRGGQMYYGANTGRWAGKGMQPHNFVKSKDKLIPDIITALKLGDYELFRDVFGDVHTSISKILRGLIIPEKGKTFFDTDWNAIEARIILWLASDDNGLEVFRKGIDPYKDLATYIFEKELIDVDDDERQAGKIGVLGCGFGMGHEKMALQYGIDPVLAHKIVKTWRKQHEPVKSFWRGLQQASCDAVENPGRYYRAGKHIKFIKRRNMLLCYLPSLRPLYYPLPRVSTSYKKIKIKTPYRDSKDNLKNKVEIKTIPQRVVTHVVFKGAFGFRRAVHGCVLAENVTQATARDIVGHVMLRNRKIGKFPQVLSLHDEILSEVKKGSSQKEFKKIMSLKPTWAKGLPLETSFWSHDRFGSY